MSVHLQVMFFYAMPIQDGEVATEEIDPFNWSQDQVEIIDLTPSGESDLMLFIEDSQQEACDQDDPQTVKFSDISGHEVEWRQMIVDACIKQGWTFSEPDWYFVSRYS